MIVADYEYQVLLDFHYSDDWADPATRPERPFPDCAGRRRRGAGRRIAYPSRGTINKATMLMILISGLMAGPAVSL
jgi:Glycosyl hydrolase family 53